MRSDHCATEPSLTVPVHAICRGHVSTADFLHMCSAKLIETAKAVLHTPSSNLPHISDLCHHFANHPDKMLE